MSMRKKKDQKIFMRKCFLLCSELKSISALGYHGIDNWGVFLEDIAKTMEKLKELFLSENL